MAGIKHTLENIVRRQNTCTVSTNLNIRPDRQTHCIQAGEVGLPGGKIKGLSELIIVSSMTDRVVDSVGKNACAHTLLPD